MDGRSRRPGRRRSRPARRSGAQVLRWPARRPCSMTAPPAPIPGSDASSISPYGATRQLSRTSGTSVRWMDSARRSRAELWGIVMISGGVNLFEIVLSAPARPGRHDSGARSDDVGDALGDTLRKACSPTGVALPGRHASQQHPLNALLHPRFDTLVVEHANSADRALIHSCPPPEGRRVLKSASQRFFGSTLGSHTEMTRSGCAVAIRTCNGRPWPHHPSTMRHGP